MRARLLLLALAVSLLSGCLHYEYEHEFWLHVDGSGRVHVTGQPAYWSAFKKIGGADDPGGAVLRDSVRKLFTQSGLHVRTVTLTHRRGHDYIFVAADFDDISRLGRTAAFPDLDVRLAPIGDRLQLEGTWQRPEGSGSVRPPEGAGLMAVRFHLPSKVYEHRNAADGVERGNIVAWRQDVAAALDGAPLRFGALMDRRSILWSTIGLFGTAIGCAVLVLVATLYALRRRGARPAD